MDSDVVGAGNRWIPEAEYALIRTRVPILCVDVLLSPKDDPLQVGLIRRATYDGCDGWCLVGGSVLRNEHLSEAVERHVLATLGTGVKVDRPTLELRTVIEYLTERGASAFYDPRKHAVALTYSASCECEGEPEALGEAFEFRWFKVDELSKVNFGFDQGQVVARILKTREDLARFREWNSLLPRSRTADRVGDAQYTVDAPLSETRPPRTATRDA